MVKDTENTENEELENEEVVENEEVTEEKVVEEEQDDEILGEPGKKALEKERAARKALEAEVKELRQQTEDEDERRLREAREEAAGEAETKWKARVVRAEARALLAAEGAKGNASKLLKLIDTDEVEVDEDGDVIGLEDAIETLKEDFPELFKGSAAGGADSGPKKAANKPKTSAEQLASRL